VTFGPGHPVGVTGSILALLIRRTRDPGIDMPAGAGDPRVQLPTFPPTPIDRAWPFCYVAFRVRIRRARSSPPATLAPMTETTAARTTAHPLLADVLAGMGLVV